MTSKRYITILVLINILERLRINYRIIGGDEPEDRDTIIYVDTGPVPTYFSVTNKGATYSHSPFNNEQVKYRVDLFVSVATSAVHTLQQIKGNDE